MDFRLLIWHTGRHTSVLPSVGTSICGSVYSLAFNIYEILVCACFVLGCLDALIYNRISLLFGNTIYLTAFGYYFVISFLGYNSMYKSSNRKLRHPPLTDFTALPYLHHTQFLLSPLFVCGALWFASLFGVNIPHLVGPLFKLGAGSAEIPAVMR